MKKFQPWQWHSYWKTQVIYTDEEVDMIMSEVAVVTSDPSPLQKEHAWILRTGAGAIADGTPMGLLLALTYQDNTGSATQYQFSYRTRNNTTERLVIS